MLKIKHHITNNILWKNKKLKILSFIIITGLALCYLYFVVVSRFFDYTNTLSNYLTEDFSSEIISLKDGGVIKINNNDKSWVSGFNYSKGLINRFVKLDPQRLDSATIELPDGTVLITGGRKRFPYPRDYIPKPRSSTVIYDPKTNTLKEGSYMVVPRFGHKATHLPDNKILITGGQKLKPDSEYEDLYSSEIYDISTKTFTKNSNMASQHSYHDALLLRNNKVLITDSGIGFAELYDPEKKEFNIIPNFPFSYKQKTILLGNKTPLIIVLIENEDENLRFMGKIELWKYNTDKETFKKINSPALEGVNNAQFVFAKLLPNKKVLINYIAYRPLPVTCGVIYDPGFKSSKKTGCLPMKELFNLTNY